MTPTPGGALVLDLHGVLVTPTEPGHSAFLVDIELPPESWSDIRRTYLDEEAAWDQVERGELPLEEFCLELSQRIRDAGGVCSPAEAAHIWGRPHPFRESEPRRRLLRFALDRRPDVQIAIATNSIPEWRPVWEQLLPGVDGFDHTFDSSAMGARKPETRFWEQVEAQLGCSGSAIVNVDDRPQFVAAAQRRGWTALRFETEDQILGALTAG